MSAIDWAVLGLILLTVGGAVTYIVRAKKKGQKCIGCPDSKTCGGNCALCSCSCHKRENESPPS